MRDGVCFEKENAVANDTKSATTMVGVAGLEPAASWSRTMRDTKLRHTPIDLQLLFYHRGTSTVKPYFAEMPGKEEKRRMRRFSGADNGNRTHLSGLGSRCSTNELYPHFAMQYSIAEFRLQVDFCRPAKKIGNCFIARLIPLPPILLLGSAAP